MSALRPAARWLRVVMAAAMAVPAAAEVCAAEGAGAVDQPVWVEVEDALGGAAAGAVTTFPTTKAGAWLFAGHSLFVDQPALPELGGAYHVTIDFALPREQRVAVWIAGSPPADAAGEGARWVSPVSVAVDDQRPTMIDGTSPVAAWYADGANAWYPAGDYPLPAGAHRLRLTVAGPRVRDGHYAAEVDAVLILPEAWSSQVGDLLQWSEETWMVYLAATKTDAGISFDDLRRQVEAVRTAPEDLTAQAALAATLREAELWDAGERVWRAILAKDPAFRPALEGLARLAAERERWTEAADWYGQLVALAPEDVALQREYLDMLEAAERLDEAATVLARLLQRQPEDRELLARAATLARWRDRPADAVTYDLQRYTLGQLDREGTIQLIQDLMGLARHEEALALVKTMSPDRDAEALALLQQVIADLPDPRRQAQEYEALVQLRPDDVDLRLAYAEALEAAERTAEAIAEYRIVIAARPRDAALLRRMAERQRWVSDLAGAIDSYRAALLLEDDDATRRALLQALIDASRLAEAAEEARALLARHPTDRALHRTLARIHTWNDRPRDALKEYDQVLLLGPRDAELSVERGKLYEWLGRDREAAVEYRLAVQADPSHAEARERLRAMRLREREEAPGPGLRWVYFEDSRHIARWVTAGRVQWNAGEDPIGLEYGLMGVHDRQGAVNGQFVMADWEHLLGPDWSIRTEQGVAVYDTDHASYQYNWMLGHRASDRWQLSLEHTRHDVWETPTAVEQGISVADLEVASKSRWTERLEHVAWVNGGWYTDGNDAISLSNEWIYRLFEEPLVTVGGGYTFEHFAHASADEAYYSPDALHTVFGRAAYWHHPTDRVTHGGEYIVAYNDISALSHEVKGTWDYRLVKDLWFRLFGRYFTESARFGDERYFEREIGSHLKWKF
jgi:tetratricopeptide (TPR) repeat protein